jgi:transposase
MKTTSMDLRSRIVATYDEGKSTREEVARRYRVSLGMVKKLLAQRRAIGDIAPQHHRSGGKPKIQAAHRSRMRELLSRKPDLTLAELREAVALDCTLPAIHYVLADMGLSYKKRHCAPASRGVPTSRGRGGAGGGSSPGSTRRGSSSSMKAQPRRT